MSAPEPVRPPDRWEAERAVKSSDLPPIARHLLLDLLTYMDAGSLAVPYRWSPSLTGLSADTAWTRRTVIRWLDYLEQAGWLARLRPTVHDARVHHRRTAYTVLIPNRLVTDRTQSRDSQTPGLVTERAQARDRMPSELGTHRPEAGDPARLKPDQPDQPDQPDLTELVIRTLHRETGQTVDAAWAAETAATILSRPGIKNERAYLIRILTVDPNRWLPTPTPPPYQSPQEDA